MGYLYDYLVDISIRRPPTVLGPSVDPASSVSDLGASRPVDVSPPRSGTCVIVGTRSFAPTHLRTKTRGRVPPALSRLNTRYFPVLQFCTFLSFQALCIRQS